MSDFLSNIGNKIADATMSPVVKAGAEAAETLKENSGGIFDEVENLAKNSVTGQVAQFVTDKLEDSDILNEVSELFNDATAKLKGAVKNGTISPVTQMGADFASKSVKDALQSDKSLAEMASDVKDNLAEGYKTVKESLEPKTKLGKFIKEKTTEFINETIEKYNKEHPNPLELPDIKPNSGGNI